MTTAKLAALVAALEIPECGCVWTMHKFCNCELSQKICDCEEAEEGEEGCDCPREDLPPCDCPRGPGPPCEHILARLHDLTIEEWAAVLHQFSTEYIEPPPPKPTTDDFALSRQARVEIYKRRALAGVSLFSLSDVWNQAEKLMAGLQTYRKKGGAPARLRNGRPNPHETLSR